MYLSNWLLSVSLLPNGDVHPYYSVIDHRAGKSTRFRIYRHCLQKSVEEKLAFMRLLRGNWDDHVYGTWIGDNHFVVALDKDEYKNLVTRVEKRWHRRQKVGLKPE